jgi:hypothetical protein
MKQKDVCFFFFENQLGEVFLGGHNVGRVGEDFFGIPALIHHRHGQVARLLLLSNPPPHLVAPLHHLRRRKQKKKKRKKEKIQQYGLRSSWHGACCPLRSQKEDEKGR